jgi:hypothetical protein
MVKAATTARAPGLHLPGLGNLDNFGRLGGIGLTDDSVTIQDLRVRDVKVSFKPTSLESRLARLPVTVKLPFIPCRVTRT